MLDAVRWLIGPDGSTLQPATEVRITPAVTVTSNSSLESSHVASANAGRRHRPDRQHSSVPRVSGTKLLPALDFMMLRRDEVCGLSEICLHSAAGARNIRGLAHGDEVMTPCSLGF